MSYYQMEYDKLVEQIESEYVPSLEVEMLANLAQQGEVSISYGDVPMTGDVEFKNGKRYIIKTVSGEASDTNLLHAIRSLFCEIFEVY